MCAWFGSASPSRDGRMRPSPHELIPFSALHRGDVSGVDPGFFGFQEAADQRTEFGPVFTFQTYLLKPK